jgi:hypothetical protein
MSKEKNIKKEKFQEPITPTPQFLKKYYLRKTNTIQCQKPVTPKNGLTP